MLFATHKGKNHSVTPELFATHKGKGHSIRWMLPAIVFDAVKNGRLWNTLATEPLFSIFKTGPFFETFLFASPCLTELSASGHLCLQLHARQTWLLSSLFSPPNSTKKKCHSSFLPLSIRDKKCCVFSLFAPPHVTKSATGHLSSPIQAWQECHRSSPFTSLHLAKELQVMCSPLYTWQTSDRASPIRAWRKCYSFSLFTLPGKAP